MSRTLSRTSVIARFGLLATGAMVLPQLLACLDHPLKPVYLEKAQEEENNVQLSINKDVDILFVIDNSGSMGEEQEVLAANFGAFINVLEDPDVQANYRMGVTTTDNGNPACNGTTPEGGGLRATSCLSRLSDFTFLSDPPVDKEAACTSVCNHPTIEILPTATERDANRVPRPWIERIEDVTNVGGGVTMTEAFACIGPQGINGCGFEQHLESMYKGILRMQESSEKSYGFIREAAILAIVLISDEADGSINGNNGAAIFSPSGNRVFWEDTSRAQPTSAVVWNAGVLCSPAGGPTYDECHAENKDVNGNNLGPATQADGSAVLHSLPRYINLVQDYENQKRVFDASQEVLLAGIVGVPNGYPGVPIEYKDHSDPNEQINFGIGPGCLSSNGDAVPPVREREFIENFRVGSTPNLFSICDQDYSGALAAIAEKIAEQVKPACMKGCVKDVELMTEELDPDCSLEQQSGGGEKIKIPECSTPETLSGGQTVCFDYFTGAEMDPQCIADGWNLEFKLTRLGQAPAGTVVRATCQLSQTPDIDCPNLG